MKILAVTSGCIADELGITAGDELVSFDGFPVIDVLDYDFYNSRENFVMRVKSRGEIVDYEIEKDDDEDLGLELSTELPIRQCRNRCIFCFVDQLPKENLRDTLKVKDDDYRHSFIFGNYVTLTNVSESELNRIVRLKLTPLFVSVHSSNHELRCKMLGTDPRKTPDIMKQLRKLHEGGIMVHAQIVYCPGVNDDLDRTIRDISPYTVSLAVVPVGLTKNCNPTLKRVDFESANAVIDIVEKWQPGFLEEKFNRYVYAADEFYLTANREIPSADDYDNFWQMENGVGLIADFKYDFEYALSCYTKGSVGEVSIATGVSAYPLIRESADIVEKKYGGKIHVYAVKNEFFGESVTVAGLVVGRDIISQLKGQKLGDRLFLPRVMLREFGDVFLDGTTLEELSKALGVKVQVVAPDGESFIKGLIGVDEDE